MNWTIFSFVSDVQNNCAGIECDQIMQYHEIDGFENDSEFIFIHSSSMTLAGFTAIATAIKSLS